MRRICGMKKIRQNLLHICLTITILISILFSALIWINPATFQRPVTNEQKDSTTVRQDNGYDITDIYFPTSILYNVTNEQHYLISSKKIDLIRNIKDLGKNWNAQKLKQMKVTSDKDYLHYLTLKNAVVLRYPDRVSTLLFARKKAQKKTPKYDFNWIVLSLKAPYHAYLLNDSKRQVYQMVSKEKTSTKAAQLLQDNRVKKTEIDYRKIGSNYVITYPQPVSVPKYSYLVNKENAGVYIGRLLGTSNSSSITTREQKEVTVYSDDNGKKLTVNNQSGEVTFDNYNESRLDLDGKRSLYYNLKANFDLLSSLGLALDDIRYDNYNAKTATVTYRSYINSYPIIAKNCYGTFKAQTKSNGARRLDFSLDTLQIPVPANGQASQLPTTDSMLEQLQQAGVKLDELSDLTIGYRWSDNASADMVVDLTPTYFVKYQGSWCDYQDLLLGNFLPIE